MNIEMSYLLLAFATVLAPLAQGQSTPPQPKITGVLTILTPKPGVTVEQVMKIMPAEIRATVPLYLDGKIQQWFTRGAGHRPGKWPIVAVERQQDRFLSCGLCRQHDGGRCVGHRG